jgi:hypothetical protein
MAVETHKYGTDDGWHGVIKKGGEFPPERDRYHLYIGKSHCLILLQLSGGSILHEIKANSTETNE